jgi:hypothetical protein
MKRRIILLLMLVAVGLIVIRGIYLGSEHLGKLPAFLVAVIALLNAVE